MALTRNPLSVLPVSMDKEAPPILSLGDYVELTYPANFQADDANFEVDAFKLRTTAGTCLEFYNGRLYMALGNFVYCTKAHDIEHYDIRYNVVAGFEGPVRMIARVTDGLYIATDNNTYFLQGAGPKEKDAEGDGFVQRHVMKYGAIYGTVARWQSDIITEAGTKETSVVWASTIGVVVGSNSGNYKMLSLNQITMPSGLTGTAIVKEWHGIYQYICCFNVDGSLFINNSEGVIIDNAALLDTWVVNLTNSMHSRFTNYLFNSFFRFRDDYYGSNTLGIFKLTGDRDFKDVVGLESQIDAFVLTPVTDFNKQEQKQVSDGFLNARCSGDMQVSMTVDEDNTYTEQYVRYQDKDGVYRKRVKLPRGVQGNNYQFKISNIDGSFFKIFDFEILVRTLKRVIGMRG